MPDIDTSTSQTPLYTPPSSTDLAINEDANTATGLKTIQTNGDVVTDTVAAYTPSDANVDLMAPPVTDYSADASTPRIPNPSDSRTQVASALVSDDSDTNTTQTPSDSGTGDSSVNGEEPVLFANVDDPSKKQNSNGNSSGGDQSQGQPDSQAAKNVTTNSQAPANSVPAGETPVGQTPDPQGKAIVPGAIVPTQGAPGTTTTGAPTAADLQQFNPNLPANNPFGADPLDELTDILGETLGVASNTPGGTDAVTSTAVDTDPGIDIDSTNIPPELDATPAEPAPIPMGPPQLADGQVVVVNGEPVVIDSSKANNSVVIIQDGVDTPPTGPVATKLVVDADPAVTNLKVLGNLDNSLKSMTDVLDQAQKIADALPDSAEKTSFLNFLQSVSKNLLLVSDMLYKLEIINTKQSKEASQVQKEAAIHDITERAKAEKKRLKKSAKAKKKAKFGVLNKIFSFVKIIFMAVALAVVQAIPGLGQIAGAYIAAAMVDEICKTCGIKYSCTQALTKAVAGAVVGMMPYLSDSQKEACRTAVKGICAGVCLAAMFASPVSFAMGGGAAIQASLIDSGLITNESLKSKLGMALGVAMAVAGIVMAVVMMCIPGGQAAAMSSIFGSAAKIADIAGKVLSVVMATVTVTTEVNEALIADLNMQIAKIKGGYESTQALIQMLIALMKQLMKTLQDGIKAFSGQIATIQQGLQSNFSNLNASLGALYNAT